jgi:hypothetical protein
LDAFLAMNYIRQKQARVKSTLLDYQRIVGDEPITVEKWALKYAWNLVPDIVVMSLKGQ